MEGFSGELGSSVDLALKGSDVSVRLFFVRVESAEEGPSHKGLIGTDLDDTAEVK